jgi:hypothetical protein
MQRCPFSLAAAAQVAGLAAPAAALAQSVHAGPVPRAAGSGNTAPGQAGEGTQPPEGIACPPLRRPLPGRKVAP